MTKASRALMLSADFFWKIKITTMKHKYWGSYGVLYEEPTDFLEAPGAIFVSRFTVPQYTTNNPTINSFYQHLRRNISTWLSHRITTYLTTLARQEERKWYPTILMISAYSNKESITPKAAAKPATSHYDITLWECVILIPWNVILIVAVVTPIYTTKFTYSVPFLKECNSDTGDIIHDTNQECWVGPYQSHTMYILPNCGHIISAYPQ